ncbi:MAG: ADP-glyceromanno-heptose 6-epimerase, partial [Elusimicrobia bacterium]|nr:ADP-glyceromanno-heptose 6-epimerase [Elusimicrobiota bacterium]
DDDDDDDDDVKDVVRANMLALKVKGSSIFNIGTGKPENFNKVIACLNKELGLNLKTEYFDNPYGFYQNKTQAWTDLAWGRAKFKTDYSIERGIADYARVLEGK